MHYIYLNNMSCIYVNIIHIHLLILFYYPSLVDSCQAAVAVVAFSALAYDHDVLNMDFLFHRQLSGATIFPLCVRMPRIIRRGADCLGEIVFFFVSFVLDGVDCLSVKHCPNEGLTSHWDTTFSSTSFNYPSKISRFQAKNLDLNKFNMTSMTS